MNAQALQNRKCGGKNFGSMIFLLIAVLCLLSPTNASICAVAVKSSSALPVANAYAEIRNISSGALMGFNYSDTGGVVYWNTSCEDVNWSISYPLSAYSAVIQNLTVSNQVYLNSYASGCVQLVNTLGEYLEGQDASVVAYVANTSILVHDYKTQCVMKPQLVCHGSEGCNYESVSDCAFTDSQGWYCFKGLVTEVEGFEFNGYYDLTFTINAKQARLPFHVVNEKPTDFQKIEDWIRNNGGTIILMILGSLAVAGFAGLLFWIARGGKGKGKAKNKGF